MKTNVLRRFRIIPAILFFSLIFLFFCDFANFFPKQLHGILHIQFIPAFISGSAGILIFLFLLTILFGRIYCSIICPLGILQDIIARFNKIPKKKRKYKYARPFNIIRYSILIICILFLIFGITTPLLLLDPYSNFGRIAVNIFRPVFIEGNNLLNLIALKFHVYKFYYITIHTFTIWSFSIAAFILLTVGIMAFLRGRLYCNTICPVGSLLGLISKFSLYKINIDGSKCTSCRLCENACKSQCINSKEKFVDNSRCVSCFNCLKRCKSDSIDFRFTTKRAQSVVKEVIKPEIITNRTNEIGITRRSFLVTSTALAAILPVISAWAKTEKEIDQTKLTPITPPGSISLARFKKQCTACHLCITHCPQQILKPAGFNFGLDYAFKPHLVFYEKGFCNYSCTACTLVCPNGAIKKLTVEEKKISQIGVAKLDHHICVVHTDHTSCGACSEHCPTQAVKMEPYINGLTSPHVYEELCIGCGGCESICPVRPIKAINVLANEVHQTAEIPPESEILEVDHEELDFGF